MKSLAVVLIILAVTNLAFAIANDNPAAAIAWTCAGFNAGSMFFAYKERDTATGAWR
jgi:hypothetical protein